MKMKTSPMTIALAALLVACSGGGGDPGTCNASAETCAGTGGSSGGTSSSGGDGSSGSGGSGTGGGTSTGAPVFVTDAQIQRRITCPEIEALNGGDKQLAWLAIQQAFARGAEYLDGNPKNGVPCSSYGYPP